MEQTIKAHLLAPEDVAYMWEEVVPLLARVAPHTEGEMEPDDYIEPLTHGDMQLWVVVENKRVIAALITQIIPYPQKKILRLISLAGEEFDKIKDFLDVVEAFAIKYECSALEMWGRKGWKKLLPDWKDSYIVYTKDIRTRMQ
jgi:hypothetical protein